MKSSDKITPLGVNSQVNGCQDVDKEIEHDRILD